MIMKTTLKQKAFFIALLVIFAGYVSVCIPLYHGVIGKINASYFDIAQDSAQIISKAIAGQFVITDEEVSELLDLEYEELPSNKTNMRFEKIVRSITSTNNLNTDIKYAYVMYLLPEERIKYKIEDNIDAKHYGEKKGTKLDVIWLLNVNITNNRYDNGSNYIRIDEEYLSDKNRYSILRDYDAPFYEKEQAGISISNDEYGDEYISGMIPIYTTSDKYVGLLGVDIFIENYYKVMDQTKLVFKIIFISFTILFIALLTTLFLYRHNIYVGDIRERAAYSNIDPMTGIYTYDAVARYDQDILKPLKSKSIPIIAIFIKIDHMVELCQKYDQNTIDKMLVSIGATIKNNIRMPKDFPLKYSSNEFAAIFTDIPLSSVEMIAVRIVDQINAANTKIEANDLKISITIAKTNIRNVAKLEDLILAAKNISQEDNNDKIGIIEY